jgi:hypothetical protein
MSLNNAEWYEWLWLGMGLLWGSMTLWGSSTAWQDWRWIITHPATDAEMQRELRDRTRTDLRYELSSLLGALTITYFGTRALLLPPNPFALEFWGQLGAGLAVTYALVKTVTSVQNRLTRRQFDRRLARHKERIDD